MKGFGKLQRFIAIFIYWSLMSIPIAFLLCSIATFRTVPLPTKGSKTIPSLGQPALMHFSTSFSGKTAKCESGNGWVVISQKSEGFFPRGCGKFCVCSNLFCCPKPIWASAVCGCHDFFSLCSKYHFSYSGVPNLGCLDSFVPLLKGLT